MECQPSDSKTLFKVFDASRHKKSKKKREGLDDSNSVVTDSSAGPAPCRVPSAKSSLKETATVQNLTGHHDSNITKGMVRDSSASLSQSPPETHRHARSPRRYRRSAKEGVSLALKAGLVSTPRSGSLAQEATNEVVPQDQDSFIYAFLEEAIKRDKKKQRHARRREERRSRDEDDRDHSIVRERHRHHHRDRHRDDVPSTDRDIQPKAVPPPPPPTAPAIDQSMLIETFAKICVQMNNKNNRPTEMYQVPRTHSHKSLQCEAIAKRSEMYEIDRPVKLSHEKSRDNVGLSRIRSQENFSGKNRTRENSKILIPDEADRGPLDRSYYEKDIPKYPSKLEIVKSRMRHVEDDRIPEYSPVPVPTSCVDPYRTHPLVYRDYDRVMRRHYEEDKKRYYEQKTSHSFDVHREGYDVERNCRRTARSDTNRLRRHDDKRYEEVPKYYDDKPAKYYDEKHVDPRAQNNVSKDRRWRRNVDRCDRNSVASREDDYRDRDRERERDRYSERERDSGMSVADGDTSSVSGKCNYLKVVKSPTRMIDKTRGLLQQEIAEQREAMDKMMKLWKELMRCFKGISQTPDQDKNMRDSAASATESAAGQLRLWRECMRRYETVARDVGDTDARLMEEIKKQRTEMAEMATMWQECLQRYRDMSNDFNNLKQQVQLVSPESPTRLPAPQQPSCAEGEGTVAPAPFRLPHNYPQMVNMAPPPGPPGPPYVAGGSPLRNRVSAPPSWWWTPEPNGPREPRRRSSPESRTSRERERRHRHKERDEPRYKDKTKPSAARSEHRHRKR